VLDLEAELNDLMGQPIDTRLDPAPVPPGDRQLPAREILLGTALKDNPDLARAEAALEQGRSAVRAARADYIPEVGAFVRQSHQEGVPFLKSNFTTVGVSLTWSILDGGRKAGVVSQRRAQAAQAGEDRDRLRRRVEVDLGRTLRRLETARLQLEAAGEARALNAEKARLAANQRRAGIVSAARQAEADAAAKASEADLLAAQLALDLEHAGLDHLLGKP
jgi:outer membrane protein TolC